MTKRKLKSHGPTGHNKHLGNSLVNTQKVRNKDNRNPNIVEQNVPSKVIDSVTSETNLTEFLSNAELAGTTFEAERGNIRVLSKTESTIIKFDDLKQRSLEELNKHYGHLLCIPRRPNRSMYSNAEQLNAIENETFLNWKRNLCLLSEGSDVVLTPFERNLELWRQLWRVIERSDLIVQIVDARNPLMFRSADLEKYIKEVDCRKSNLLLVNKADLLTAEQIQAWHEYFVANNILAVFWSAMQSAEQEDEDEAVSSLLENSSLSDQPTSKTFTYIKSTKEFLQFLKERVSSARSDLTSFVVGMVGYPNVGKSSTINCLIGEKKTSVSATPGKTKHFQTLIIDEELTLCDCPGLVMPSFGFSNSEMILNAVLPIHNMRDYFSPIQLLCSRVPRRQFEALYSVLLPRPADHEPADRPPTAHELLTTVAFMKGFMSSAGIPDCSRSARMILKDVVDGKLKWVASPPGVAQFIFDGWTYTQLTENKKVTGDYGKNLLQQLDKRNLIINDTSVNTRVDSAFFNMKTTGAHTRGICSDLSGGLSNSKKHGNRNKREKTRRLFAHLDA